MAVHAKSRFVNKFFSKYNISAPPSFIDLSDDLRGKQKKKSFPVINLSSDSESSSDERSKVSSGTSKTKGLYIKDLSKKAQSVDSDDCIVISDSDSESSDEETRKMKRKRKSKSDEKSRKRPRLSATATKTTARVIKESIVLNIASPSSRAAVVSKRDSSACLLSDEPNLEPGFVAPSSWTPEMISFYTKPNPERRNISLQKIIASMPSKGPWPIDSTDRFKRPNPNWLRGRKVRCKKCMKMGPEVCTCLIVPGKSGSTINCFMCSTPGHFADRCPNAICFVCGSPSSRYANGCSNCRHTRMARCRRCGITGHSSEKCTDLWRMYHNTIKPDAIPAQLAGPQPDKWCSNCAQKGHIFEDCPKSRFGYSFSGSAHVASYEVLHNVTGLMTTTAPEKSTTTSSQTVSNNNTSKTPK